MTELMTKALEAKRAYEFKGIKMTYFQMLCELKDYRPEDAMFTSQEEMDFLNEFLGLDKMSAYDIQNLRDMTVMMFSDWSEYQPEKRWDYNEAMMSITAVLDYAKYRK